MSSVDLSVLLDVPVLPAETAYGYVAMRSSLFVFNTNLSWIHQDEHWVAVFFVDSHREFFFDSFGRDAVWLGFDRFMAENCKTWTYNDRQLQSLESSACGHHVTAFSVAMFSGMSYDSHISLFSDNVYLNDYLVAKWIEMWNNWQNIYNFQLL